MPKKPERHTETLRYDFADAELLGMAKLQAERLEKLEQLEEQKKQVTEDFKARISATVGDISMLRRRIMSGYEMRSVDCEVRFDDPEVGRKSTYRLDSGELLRTTPMEPAERQEELPLDQEA